MARNPFTGPDAPLFPGSRHHAHEYKANPGEPYRVRIKKHGRPDRAAVARYDRDRQWYYLSGKPIEEHGWYVESILGPAGKPPGVPNPSVADANTFNTALAKELKKLKKAVGATKIRQGYKGTGRQKFRRQVWVDVPWNSRGIDLWLEASAIGMGGVIAPFGQGVRIPYADKSPQEVYQEVEDFFREWKARPAKENSHRSGLGDFDASTEFQDGVASAIWADAFSTALDGLREDGYSELARELGPGAGDDLMDVLPPVPQAAINDARAFEAAVIDANGVDINTIIAWAQDADGVEYIDDEEFGYYIAMPALGHGVSWFDDHGDFDIKLPHWEPSVYVQNEMYDWIEHEKYKYE